MHIRVRAEPGAKRYNIKKESDTVYRISVKEPAEHNLANDRIKEMLAIELGVTAGKIRMITGHRSPNKMFDVQLATKT